MFNLSSSTASLHLVKLLKSKPTLLLFKFEYSAFRNSAVLSWFSKIFYIRIQIVTNAKKIHGGQLIENVMVFCFVFFFNARNCKN